MVQKGMGASQRHRDAAAASFPECTWNLSAALSPDERIGHVTEDDESGVFFLVSADRNFVGGVVL